MGGVIPQPQVQSHSPQTQKPQVMQGQQQKSGGLMSFLGPLLEMGATALGAPPGLFSAITGAVSGNGQGFADGVGQMVQGGGQEESPAKKAGETTKPETTPTSQPTQTPTPTDNAVEQQNTPQPQHDMAWLFQDPYVMDLLRQHGLIGMGEGGAMGQQQQQQNMFRMQPQRMM